MGVVTGPYPRPTRAAVERALKLQDGSVLAAEVRALRAELEHPNEFSVRAALVARTPQPAEQAVIAAAREVEAARSDAALNAAAHRTRVALGALDAAPLPAVPDGEDAAVEPNLEPTVAVSDETLTEAEQWFTYWETVGSVNDSGAVAEREGARLLHAEYNRRGTELERLRGRTHEIQAQEMAKRAHLDSLIAEMRARWDAAKRWTEDNELLAEWASGEHAARSFWSMTSMRARDVLARLIGERSEALADLAALRAQRDAVLALHRRADDGTFPPCCAECLYYDEDGEVRRATWPCPTARALGVGS